VIPLVTPNLDKLAHEHFRVISHYLETRAQTTIQAINEWIRNVLGSAYSFREVILAKPVELKEIRRGWLSSNHPDKVKFGRFLRYYAYLGKNVYEREDRSRFYKAQNIAEGLNLRVCPYCNENPTYTVKKDGTRTFDLDHFYNKEKYPILAISFYNLVPACKVCNHRKLDHDKDYLHPYDDQVDYNRLVNFGIEIHSMNYLNSPEGFSIEIAHHPGIDPEHKESIDLNIADFGLKGRYEHYKDVVQELIHRRQVYSDSYIDELFQNFEGSLFRTREDVLKLVLGNYITEEELRKRPLAKLTKDISEGLGFF
jgi:hypothetical protein